MNPRFLINRNFDFPSVLAFQLQHRRQAGQRASGPRFAAWGMLALIGLTWPMAAGLADLPPGMDPSQVPPEIRAAYENMKRGKPLSPADQQMLRDWHLRNTRKPGEEAGTLGTPADVQRIMDNIKRGIVPTSADRARLLQWSQEMKGKETQLKSDAQKARQELEANKPSTGISRPSYVSPKRPPILELVTQVKQDIDRHCPQDFATVHFDGAATFRVRATVTPGDGQTPASVDFKPPLDPNEFRAFGGLAMRTTGKRGDESENLSVVGQLGGIPALALLGTPASILMGSSGKRPRLHWSPNLSGKGQISGTITHGNKSESASGQAQVAAPSPLSLDLLAAGAGLAVQERLGIKLGAAADPMLEAAKQATFQFDVPGLIAALQAQSEVNFSGTYQYRVQIKDGLCTSVIVSTAQVQVRKAAAKPELVIAPSDLDDYQKWMPRPYLENAEDAKIFGLSPKDESLALNVKLMLRTPNSTEQPKGKLHVELQLTSKNKGLAANYPIYNPDTPPGIKILPNQNGWKVAPDGQSADTEEDVAELEVKVAAVEPGAYAHLHARCSSFATDVQVKPDDLGYLTIPRDIDDNKIADAWDEQNASTARAANADEDLPADQYRRGDGLTRYEEYRGIVAWRPGGELQHERLDPAKKDIFLQDRTRLVRNFGLELLPAGLGVVPHIVDERTLYLRALPDSIDNRRINPNTPDQYRFAWQYGVIVEEVFIGAYDGTTELSQSIPGCNRALQKFPGPKCTLKVKIDRMKTQAQMQRNLRKLAWSEAAIVKAIDDSLRTTVMHEIAHAYGVRHHEPGYAWPVDKNNKPVWNPDARFWSFGVYDCAMRYQEPVGHPIDHKAVFEQKRWPISYRLCRAGESSTGVNGQVSTSDNCWGQIDVIADP